MLANIENYDIYLKLEKRNSAPYLRAINQIKIVLFGGLNMDIYTNACFIQAQMAIR
jgi:hypothetical protein